MSITVYTKTRNFVNGTPNDATPVDDSFTELYQNDTTIANATNTLITDVDAAEADIVALQDAQEVAEYLLLNGFKPKYVSASQISLGKGSFRDSTNAQTFKSETLISLDLSTTGAGGRDAGSESSNTFYYVYLIGKDDGTVSAVFSTVNELVTGSIVLPSGYTKKRQLPFCVLNNASSDIEIFYVVQWATIDCKVIYKTPQAVGTANLNTSETQNLAGFVPPISRLALIYAEANGGGSSNASSLTLATDNTISPGQKIGRAVDGGRTAAGNLELYTSSTQTIYVTGEATGGGATNRVYVYGYVVTEF